MSSFPSGTSAIAKFYVAIDNQNYKWDGEDWAKCDSSTPAFTQTVTDTGDDSLKLKLDCDLARIRKRATGGSFTVRTAVEEIRLTPDGCNKVISCPSSLARTPVPRCPIPPSFRRVRKALIPRA